MVNKGWEDLNAGLLDAAVLSTLILHPRLALGLASRPLFSSYTDTLTIVFPPFLKT